jgi:hypothetical protein
MSSDEFFKIDNNKYDLIYIDGDHSATQVSLDIYNSWNNLNKGGYLILDDYMWWYYDDLKKNPSTPINEFIINNLKEIAYFKVWHQVINLILFKALFLNIFASLIYLLTICVDL